MELALCAGAIKNHAYQVRSRSRPDLFNKFADQFFVGHCFSSPATTGAAAARTAAAKSAKATAATETSAASPTPTTTATTKTAVEQQHPEQSPAQRGSHENNNPDDDQEHDTCQRNPRRRLLGHRGRGGSLTARKVDARTLCNNGRPPQRPQVHPRVDIVFLQ